MSNLSPAPAVRLDPDRHQYVVADGDHCTCLGYNAARDHTRQIAELMGRPELAFAGDDYAALSGYTKYRAAIAAWRCSRHSARTYFDPHTEPAVRRVLEACRKAKNTVRLILGNPRSGMPWLDAHDVVGVVGRSGGGLKVPLLVPRGESGGGAILTAWVLGIVDWDSGKVLFRHPALLVPDLLIRPTNDRRPAWSVLHQGIDVARFDDIGKAGAFVAFMRGATIEPRTFQ